MGYAGSSLVGVFLPIFIYEFFDLNLVALIIWYICVYVVRVPLLPLGSKLFSKIGLVPSMVIGTIAWALFYVVASILHVVPDWQPLLLLGLIVLIQGVFNATYWTPFHVDFAKFLKKGRRGKQVSILYATRDALAVIMPVLAGFLVAKYSYGSIFGIAVFIILISIIPLLFLPHVEVKYEFGFFETFKKMFTKKYRPLSLGMMAHGAEGVVSTVIWPIFLFAVFAGRHLEIGAFASIIVVVSILLRLILGGWLDKHKKRKALKLGVDLYALGWLAKAFVSSVGGVFAASTFHSFGSIMMQTPLDVMTYEKAADAGHYVDEFTTIREIALSMGRALMLIALIPIIGYFSIPAAFVAAAVISLGITVFAKMNIAELQ